MRSKPMTPASTSVSADRPRLGVLHALVLGVAALIAVGALAAYAAPAKSQTAQAAIPAGFAREEVATGIDGPTTMAFAPDGRIFVAEKTGALRVVKKNGQNDYELLPEPFAKVNVDSGGERGLLGVAIDPAFESGSPFVYVYYTVPANGSRPAYNRIVRFRASDTNPDVAAAGSARVIFSLDFLDSVARNHNGGAMNFGREGKLFVAVGDNAQREETRRNSQTFNTLLGKMLRINKDGSIPTDNPFYKTTAGRNKAIWARGLRNPYTFDIQPSTGKIYINDVGAGEWEEINRGLPGANYGWPYYEGPFPVPGYSGSPAINHTRPIFAYRHGDNNTNGCAITGGAFYTGGTDPSFPSSYNADYFYADFCKGYIRRYDPNTDRSIAFVSGLNFPVDLEVGPDGSLYYLERGGANSLSRISYTG